MGRISRHLIPPPRTLTTIDAAPMTPHLDCGDAASGEAGWERDVSDRQMACCEGGSPESVPRGGLSAAT